MIEARAEPDLLTHATLFARQTGALLLERFGSAATGVVSKSSPTDLVSDADRAAERLLVDLITSSYPDDRVLGEEGDGKPVGSGRLWTVDPLDGTINYLYGLPWWAVSIGVSDELGDLIGVVYVPVLDETFVAERGRGARMNGESIRVSDAADLHLALIATGFAYDERARKHQAEVVARVLPWVRDIRRMGSAAIDMCSAACGRVDGFYEAHLEEWDMAAGRLILIEAGAVLGALTAPLENLNPGFLAAGPGIYDGFRKVVTGGHR